MDSKNWRPPQGVAPPPPSIDDDGGDWRSQLKPDSRQRIVNKIMATLKRHLPFSGQEGLQELKQIAIQLEEKIYSAATSQSDYLRKISLKMLTMESESESILPNDMPSNSGGVSINPQDPEASLGSTTLMSSADDGDWQEEGADDGDWQEEVYEKDWMDSNNWRPPQGEAPPPSGDGGDWRSQLQPDSRQRIVNKIMATLKRHLPFSGQEGLQELKQIAMQLEEKIYSAATSQSDYLRKISLKILTMESACESTLPNDMPSNSGGVSINPQDPEASLDSTALMSSAGDGDWQKEVYKKIKNMKDLHYADLNKLYEKVSIKFQQSKFDQIATLRVQQVLEMLMQILQITENNILPSHRENVPSFENQIVSILNAKRPRKSDPSDASVIPSQPPSMLQSHPQVPQAQSHDGEAKPQLLSMNFSGSIATMLQNSDVEVHKNNEEG